MLTQVPNRAFEYLHRIAEVADAGVALEAEDATNLAGVVIVIDSQRST